MAYTDLVKRATKNREYTTQHKETDLDGFKARTYATHRAYRERSKQKAHDHLGGVCRECGFTDIRALQVDHINGGGLKETKGRDQGWIFRDVIKHPPNTKYQLLCANCNWIKRVINQEAKGANNPRSGPRPRQSTIIN